MKISGSRKDAGFTLVEVLISLFIFALISAGTMGAMLQTFSAKDRLNAASSELADIAAFRSILRADMNAMTLRPMRDGVGGTETYLVTTRNPEETSAILTFSRLGRSNPTGAARGQVERVRYLFRDGLFIRESLKHENPAQRNGWSGRVLLDELQDVSILYRSRQRLANASSTDLVLEDWSVLLSRQDTRTRVDGAIEFKVTDISGTVTSHLFEVGS